MKTPQEHGELKEESQAIKYPDTTYLFFGQSLLLVTGNSFSEEHNALANSVEPAVVTQGPGSQFVIISIFCLRQLGEVRHCQL